MKCTVTASLSWVILDFPVVDSIFLLCSFLCAAHSFLCSVKFLLVDEIHQVSVPLFWATSRGAFSLLSMLWAGSPFLILRFACTRSWEFPGLFLVRLPGSWVLCDFCFVLALILIVWNLEKPYMSANISILPSHWSDSFIGCGIPGRQSFSLRNGKPLFATCQCCHWEVWAPSDFSSDTRSHPDPFLGSFSGLFI